MRISGNQIIRISGSIFFLILLSSCTPTKHVSPPAAITPQPSVEILANAISFDLANGEIRYILPEPALVRIRIGMTDGGPMIRTLVDWEFRKVGLNIEKWDKKDALGLVDFSHLANLMLVLACQRIDGQQYAPSVRGSHKSPEFDVLFLNTQGNTDDGIPIILQNTETRVVLADKDKEWLTNAGYEIVMYVDQVFLIEGEKGVSPFNYNLKIEGFNEGYHSVTVNVVAFSGEVGTKSIKFFI